MIKLTTKNASYEWKEAQQNSFKALKEKLLSDAKFSHRDLLTLNTDASKVGVPGILLQQQNEWWIITCCSRRLSRAEEYYGISDLEGLAIVYCLTKLRDYILGQQFMILTDHSPLRDLKNKAPNSLRLRRWSLLSADKLTNLLFFWFYVNAFLFLKLEVQFLWTGV